MIGTTRAQRGHPAVWLWFSALVVIIAIANRAGAQAVRVPARITQRIDAARLVTLKGNTHPLARREYDRGPAPEGLPLNRILLVLRRSPQQEASLREMLDEQQVKSSPSYHKWLTPEQFGRQFGPADADVQTLTGWLNAQGFEIDRVAAGRTAIEFSGSAGMVRQAFHTAIHKFSVNGQAYWANASDPQVPAAIAPVVAGIASLNNFPRRPMSRRLGTVVVSGPKGKVTPLFTYVAENGQTYHAIGPTDFATIYNVLPLWNSGIDGTGQTIAIVAASNIQTQDLISFRMLFGLPAGNWHVITNGPDPGILKGGYELEAILDAEWSGAVAKNAQINLVVSEGAATSSGLDLSALYIVDNNLAPVMSDSYGYCEAALGAAGNAFYDSLWEQAAAEGITVIVAAGDAGSAACEDTPGETAAQQGLAVSGFASTPFDVAVGGTDFADGSNSQTYWSANNSSANQSSVISYIPETAWNDSCAQSGVSNCSSDAGTTPSLAAGSGGPSTCGVWKGDGSSATCAGGYPKPSWQSGPGVPNDNVRDVPDVSLYAGMGRNNTFYLMCEADQNLGAGPSCSLTPGGQFQAAGGTSTSAQAFAGIMAMVDQKTGGRQGNPNYVLYKLAAQSGASCASGPESAANASCIFHDIVTGNNSLPCAQGSPGCGATGTALAGVLVNPADVSAPAWAAGGGYDLATGLGSVNAANLVNAWNSVSFAPSTTKLISVSPTSLTHGEPVSVNVQVSAQSGTPATPTGAVSLIANLNGSQVGLGAFTLSDGAATGTLTSLPGGTYGVTAHYAGDGNFGGSDSTPPVQITVGKESSQTRLELLVFSLTDGTTVTNPSTIVYGSPSILHVDVLNSAGEACTLEQGSTAGCPTGSVNLYDQAPGQGAGLYPYPSVFNLNSLGQAEDQPIQLRAGYHEIVASYMGDNSFNQSTSNSDPVTVTPAPTTTVLTVSPASVQAGGSVTVTATVSTQSNGETPGGPVQFFNGSTEIVESTGMSGRPGSPSVMAQMQESFSLVPSSSETITAKYDGDSNYLGSTSAPQTITLLPGFTMSVNPASLTIPVAGESGTAAITIASGGGFTGAVTFTCQIPATMQQAGCSFSPAAVMTSGSSTLTITTTEAAATLVAPGDWLLPGGGILLVICVFGWLVSDSRRRLAWSMAALPALLLVLASIAGCGGGNGGTSGAGGGRASNAGTSAGTYTITIRAAGGSISHSSNLSVGVLSNTAGIPQ